MLCSSTYESLDSGQTGRIVSQPFQYPRDLIFEYEDDDTQSRDCKTKIVLPPGCRLGLYRDTDSSYVASFCNMPKNVDAQTCAYTELV